MPAWTPRKRASPGPTTMRPGGWRILPGHLEGVVGLDHRVVVIAPEPAFDLLHAADAADALDVAGRNQVVAAGHHALQQHFRRLRQHPRRFLAQRRGQQGDRGQREDQQREHQHQADVLGLAPRQRSQREVNQVALLGDPEAHGFSGGQAAASGCRRESVRDSADGPGQRNAGRRAKGGGCSAPR